VVKSLASSAQTVNILEVNQTPILTVDGYLDGGMEPGGPVFVLFAQANDSDLPHSSPGNPGYVCVQLAWTTCPGGVFGSGSCGAGSAQGSWGHECPPYPQQEYCSAYITATDGYNASITVGWGVGCGFLGFP